MNIDALLHLVPLLGLGLLALLVTTGVFCVSMTRGSRLGVWLSLITYGLLLPLLALLGSRD